MSDTDHIHSKTPQAGYKPVSDWETLYYISETGNVVIFLHFPCPDQV